MRKIFITSLLVLSAISAQAFVCPPQVVCINNVSNPAQAKCYADLPGSQWVAYNISTLPSDNTPHYFKFYQAISNYVLDNPGPAYCSYSDNKGNIIATFTTTLNLVADRSVLGNKWTFSEGYKTGFCYVGVSDTHQCPFKFAPSISK